MDSNSNFQTANFPQFQRLPHELKLLIWEATLNSISPRIVSFDVQPVLAKLDKIPSLLHACHLSRNVALKRYEWVTYTGPYWRRGRASSTSCFIDYNRDIFVDTFGLMYELKLSKLAAQTIAFQVWWDYHSQTYEFNGGVIRTVPGSQKRIEIRRSAIGVDITRSSLEECILWVKEDDDEAQALAGDLFRDDCFEHIMFELGTRYHVCCDQTYFVSRRTRCSETCQRLITKSDRARVLDLRTSEQVQEIRKILEDSKRREEEDYETESESEVDT